MTRFELFRRNLWLAVRRAPVDKRALNVLLGLAGVLAYFVYLGLMIYRQGVQGALMYIALMVPAIGLALLIRRNNARDGESLLKLSATPVPDSQDLAGHRKRLAETLLRVAVLVDRAGVEVLHRMGKIDAASTGICRRRTLDLGQQAGTWERFSEGERNLLLMQEGGWQWEDQWPRIAQAEDVRVLRWVIGVDEVLTPFEHLKPDVRVALEITMKPALIEGANCLPPWDLRPEQSMALAMFNRCVAEGVQRGALTVETEETKAEFLLIAERMGADQNEDLLIGAKTVGGAEMQKIQWVGQAALRRYQVLTGVIDYLNGPMEAELEIPSVIEVKAAE